MRPAQGLKTLFVVRLRAFSCELHPCPDVLPIRFSHARIGRLRSATYDPASPAPCVLGCSDGYRVTGASAYPCVPAGEHAQYAGGSLVCTGLPPITTPQMLLLLVGQPRHLANSPLPTPLSLPSPPTQVVNCTALGAADLPSGAFIAKGCTGGAWGDACVLACESGFASSGSPDYPCTKVRQPFLALREEIRDGSVEALRHVPFCNALVWYFLLMCPSLCAAPRRRCLRGRLARVHWHRPLPSRLRLPGIRRARLLRAD